MRTREPNTATFRLTGASSLGATMNKPPARPAVAHVAGPRGRRSFAEPRIREARGEDRGEIERIAGADGQPPEDSARDPRYFAHLTSHGSLLVAEADGQLAGFAATRRVGSLTLLCDLFVDPARQGRGVGRRLLDRAFAETTDRVTFSSQDPRALPLYARYGLAPRWPLLYLAGQPARLSQANRARARRAAPQDAAKAERLLAGNDRAADYGYWTAAAGGSGLVVSERHDVIAAGAIADARVPHLVVADGADPVAALLAALSMVRAATVRLCLPGPHPALGVALRAGFLIEDLDHYMSTSDGLVRFSDVLSPALA